MHLKYFTINNVVKIYQVLMLTVLSLFAVLIMPFQTVSAEEQTLRVSPVILQITLSPQKTTKQTITIENLTNQPLPLRATLNDFSSTGEEGGYSFENTMPNPLLSWITVSDKEFILAPYEEKEITLTIKTPKSIPLGGYYGMLFFEPVIQTARQQATNITAKIGVLMLANIGVPDPKAKQADIITFQPDWFSENGTLPFLLRVQNVSLNFFTAKPAITLKPLLPFSETTQPTLLEEKIIFPGKIRRWEEPSMIAGLSPNVYEVHLQVSTGNGNKIETTRYVLVLPYIKVFLAAGGLLIVFFVIRKRNRLGKFLQTLFRG